MANMKYTKPIRIRHKKIRLEKEAMLDNTKDEDINVREFGILSFLGLLLLLIGLMGFGWFLADLVRIIF